MSKFSALSLPILFSSCVLILAAARDYDYSDGPRGPERWGSLRGEWSMCSTGGHQSPINLTKESIPRDKSLHKLEPKYNRTVQATILDLDQDIALSFGDSAEHLHINGTDFLLLEVRVHSPSEHMIDGKQFPAEVQLVHNSSDGHIAIVAFYFKHGSRPNTFLDGVIQTINSTDTSSGTLDLTALKFLGRPYYHYTGSLTTPPCSEGVDWFVIKKNRKLSLQQHMFIQNYVNGTNARPLQAVNGRDIEAYK